MWNYTSISALIDCVLSWFIISKWFLVQLWCFIGAWQISMLKVSLSTKKTPSHCCNCCVRVTLSFPETACPIQPNLAESILICNSFVQNKRNILPEWWITKWRISSLSENVNVQNVSASDKKVFDWKCSLGTQVCLIECAPSKSKS